VVQAERGEIRELLGDQPLACAPRVQVLDADQDPPSGRTGQQPCEQGRAQVPQVK
jgi:hypothetical protein